MDASLIPYYSAFDMDASLLLPSYSPLTWMHPSSFLPIHLLHACITPPPFLFTFEHGCIPPSYSPFDMDASHLPSYSPLTWMHPSFLPVRLYYGCISPSTFILTFEMDASLLLPSYSPLTWMHPSSFRLIHL